MERLDDGSAWAKPCRSGAATTCLLSLLSSALFLARAIRREMLALTAKKAETVVEAALAFFRSELAVRT